MTAAAHDSALVDMLAKITTLIDAGKYRETAETYAAFVKDHPTTRFLASEPVPFKLTNYFVKTYGSSATATYTLRHTTWAEDVKKALNEGPDAFAALLAKVAAGVAEVSKKAA